MSPAKNAISIIDLADENNRDKFCIRGDVAMFENSSLMMTNYLLEKGLDTESLRRKVIANNVANVDVPHFKRSEINFESELKRAIRDREEADNKLPALMTSERHIPFYVPRDIKTVNSRINVDYNTTSRNDGNNVDVEKEMVDAAKNLMRYNAFTTTLNHNFGMLKFAMRTA
jgi:flagellar basal-body rod protein FlgB